MNVLPADRRGRLVTDNEGYNASDYDEPMAEVAPAQSSIVLQIIAIARKWKWVIASSVVGVFILGLVITLLMTPLYTASATLEIQRELRNFTNVEGAESVSQSVLDPEYYQTQYGLLEARSLADRVAGALRLSEDPQFFALFRSAKAEEWFADGKLVSTASTRTERVREAGEILLKHIEVKPERLSRLVEISFTSPDAALSKRVIDAWAAHFIQATLERRYETTSYARKFLEDRLGQLRTRIDESERQLVAYADREGIITLPAEVRASGQDGPQQTERSLAADDLATINRELARATADRILAESRRGGPGGELGEALVNQAITTMRATRADLSAQYAKLMNQFEPSYPPAQALQSQIRQLDRSISAEEGRIRRSVDEVYRAAVARERELTARVSALKSGVLDQRRRSIQYAVIQREVDTNRELYDALLQRYKEIGVAGGVGVNNISVVDPAERPVVPSSPNLVLNLALSLLIGLGVGAGIALLLEQLSDSINDPAEISGALGVSLLGTVPKVGDSNVIETLDDPKETLTEAYITLRTSLSFTTDHGFPRSIAITSARPAEGKSTTAYAIAHSLARPERRVLLIDADMRSPSLQGMIGVSGTSGLSNYLSGSDDIQSLIHQAPQAGLHVLLAGPQPPSAADLLSGDRFEQLVAQLIEKFDHVIVDAPPVMGLADAPLIASRVEGTVFVIEAHATGKGVARVAISRLQAAHARLLGVVVSKFDTKRAHYGYGYDYGYGYGYGGQGETER